MLTSACKRAIKQWNKLPTETMASLSLEMLKTQWEIALHKL